MKRHDRFGGKRRNPNASPVRVLRAVVMVAIIMVAVRIFWPSERARPPGSAGSGGGATAIETDRYPVPVVRKQLADAPVGEAQQGIALAVLLDTSGSMNGRAGGQRKIDAAGAAVLELFQTTARIATESPETPVLIGLYEFPSGPGSSVREVIALQPPDAAAAQTAIESVRVSGGTPIGDAIIRAKRDLDATGMFRQHILVVTDGENTTGPNPQTVLMAMNDLEDRPPAAIYFVAFDIGADVFDPVKNAGGVVLPAANPEQLRQTLNELLTGRIMVE